MSEIRNVEVTRAIDATPELLYAMVSDVTRMGDWSPESRGAEWRGGATGAVVGAKFRGKNQRGFRRWSTTCTVTAADPGKSFIFDVHFGPIRVATWGYSFEPEGEGCRVTERWSDHRSKFFAVLSGVATGVQDRAAHNRSGMEATLEAIAACAATHSH